MNPLLDLIVGGWKDLVPSLPTLDFPITINGPNGTTNTNTFGQTRANQYRKTDHP